MGRELALNLVLLKETSLKHIVSLRLGFQAGATHHCRLGLVETYQLVLSISLPAPLPTRPLFQVGSVTPFSEKPHGAGSRVPNILSWDCFHSHCPLAVALHVHQA